MRIIQIAESKFFEQRPNLWVWSVWATDGTGLRLWEDDQVHEIPELKPGMLIAVEKITDTSDKYNRGHRYIPL